MTRANLVLFSIIHNIKLTFERGSDGYLEDVLPGLKEWDGTIKSLRDLSFTPGQVGNFSYWYELNADTGEIKAWESQMYFKNAPSDWKEKGYNCWKGSTGKYGWTDWRKGKPVHKGMVNVYKPFQVPNDPGPYTSKELKLLRESKDYDVRLLALNWKKPYLVKAGMIVDNELYNLMYAIPFDELPLKINDYRPEWKQYTILKWRLEIRK